MILLTLSSINVPIVQAGDYPPTGTLLVLNISDSNVAFISLKSGKMTAMLPIDKGPHKMAVSPDGKKAVISNHDFDKKGISLSVIDILSQKIEKRIDLKEYGRPHSVVYLPNENSVLLSVEGDHSILKVEVQSGRVVKTAKIGNMWVARAVDVSSDGTRAYVSQVGWGTLSIVDLNNFELQKIIYIDSATEGFDISPDDKEIWVTIRARDKINIVGSEQLKIMGSLKTGTMPVRLKFTVDGKHALVSNALSGDISIINTSSRKEIHRLKLNTDSMDSKYISLSNSNYSMGENPKPIDLLIHPGGAYAYVVISNAGVISEIDLKSFKISRLIKTGKNPGGLGYSHLD